MKSTGTIAAATTLTGLALPQVHAAQDDTIQVALVGCGGRGTGAAVDAFSVKRGPLKVVAMADIFEHRLATSYNGLVERFLHHVDGPRFTACHAKRAAGREYPDGTLFTLQAIEGPSLVEATKLRVCHGFGDPQLTWRGRTYQIPREEVLVP